MKNKQIIFITVICALLVATLACGSSSNTKTTSHDGPQEVTIKHDCTMFDKTALESDGWEGEMWALQSGITCTLLDKDTWKLDLGDGGSPIYYYHLKCKGYVGYVNTTHVRK